MSPYWKVDGFSPRKSRGQNFLVDGNQAERLVKALMAPAGSRVLEIGPGTGTLTRRLRNHGYRVVAVEKDRALAAFLRGELPDLDLREEDFLALDPGSLGDPPPGHVLANIPYSITTPILLKLLDWPVPFSRLVLTMQKEVAERIMAPPGGRVYGRLSVMVALTAQVERLFDVPPAAFRPRPRVWSTALAFTPARDRPVSPFRGSVLERVIQAAFATRRKQAANSLALHLKIPREVAERALTSLGLSADIRAEAIAPGAFPPLAKLLQSLAT